MGAQTDEILKEIKKGTVNENNVDFIDENTVRQEIREKINADADYDSMSKFAIECSINPSHLSDFFNNGKNLGRNKLLAVLINLKYDLESIQSMLSRFGISPLYARNRRDYQIIIGIRNGKSLDDIDVILRQKNFEPIIPNK